MIRREDSLNYHSAGRPGKIAIKATKPCLSPREMRLAYLPGAMFPAEEIVRDPAAVYRYTARSNLVGVITNGTALTGVGDVGPAAAKPMQEGMAVLFKRLADIDVFDLELDTTDVDRFVDTVAALEPTFGAINLKDIRAPEGLQIYERLCEVLSIPVFHENLYGAAVVAVAAIINALELVGKSIDEVRVTLCGAGTVGTGCGRLLLSLGVHQENLLVYDKEGLLHPGREDLKDYQRAFQRDHPAHRLEEGIEGADIFLGASAGGVLSQEMLRRMARFPIVLALATPEPEIAYEEAVAARRDIIVATGFGVHPNAIRGTLSFPYIIRGALDVRATKITEGMLLAAARALAELAREEVVEEVERAYTNERFSFGANYLVPKPIDPRILVCESSAVAECAMRENVARLTLDGDAYRESLRLRLGTGRETLRGLVLRARQHQLRVVFSGGTREAVLRACRILIDEEIASPIVLGNGDEVRRAIDRIGVNLGGLPVVDPDLDPRLERYVEEYFRMRGRRGVMRPAAADRVRHRDRFAAMMVHAGDADMMIGGSRTDYAETLRTILEVIGTAPGVRRVSSHYLVLLPKDAVLIADCAVNIEPNAEELAEIALLAARTARAIGIEPKVAMLSFSNFGTIAHPHADKMRRATEIARERDPGLVIDGEMQLAIARDSALRQAYFPFAALDHDANVLIFPDLQSGNLTMQSLQYLGEAVPIGPILMGTRLPAHLLPYGATVEEVVNLTAIGAVEAAALGHREVPLRAD